MPAAQQLGELQERPPQVLGGVAVVVEVDLDLAVPGAAEPGQGVEVLGLVLVDRVEERVPRRAAVAVAEPAEEPGELGPQASTLPRATPGRRPPTRARSGRRCRAGRAGPRRGRAARPAGREETIVQAAAFQGPPAGQPDDQGRRQRSGRVPPSGQRTAPPASPTRAVRCQAAFWPPDSQRQKPTSSAAFMLVNIAAAVAATGSAGRHERQQRGS